MFVFIEVNGYEEVMSVNNGMMYGFFIFIYIRSLYYVSWVVKDVVSGLVYINNGIFNVEMGVVFGGMKMSGNGYREVFYYVFDVMIEWKFVYINY